MAKLKALQFGALICYQLSQLSVMTLILCKGSFSVSCSKFEQEALPYRLFLFISKLECFVVHLQRLQLSFDPTVSEFRIHQQNRKHRRKMSSPAKPTTSIDDLPPEMISELFEYLPPKDLAVCAMVNRRWHSIYVGFKVHRLAATDYRDYYPFHDFYKWYDSNQTIWGEQLCSPANIPRLAEKPLLSNLKHLALYDVSSEFDLNKLNQFRQLVHLEIGWFDKVDKINLNLPRLKVLALRFVNDRCALSIDCPELSTLVYYSRDVDANPFDVKHPQTIRKLETNWFSPKLSPFENVECLLTEEFKAISKATLLLLPGLRELHYNQKIANLLRTVLRNRGGTLDRVKRRLSEFVDDAKKLKGRDFQFNFSGFELTKVNVDQIDFGLQVDESSGEETVYDEYIYLKNYQLIEPGALLPFVHHVDYTRLLSNVTGEFPRFFPQKFTDVHSVQARSVIKDPNQFLRFLKSLRFLRVLDLGHVKLGQEFYDQLPASAHSLAWLFLKDYNNCKNELQLNFDFIGKLSFLSFVRIDQFLSFDSLPSLVRSLGKLAVDTFFVRLKEECLSKNKGSPVWKIEKDDQLLLETKNPEKIVHFFEELQAVPGTSI